MKTVGLTLILVVYLVSCSKPFAPGSQDLNVLIESVYEMREGNLAVLSTAKRVIREKGDRALDIELLDNVGAALALRTAHNLDLNFRYPNDSGSPNISDQDVSSFVSTFGKTYEQLNYGKKSTEKALELRRLASKYLDDKTLLNALLLDLQILRLERDLINTLAISIGDTETFGLEGKIYAYPQTSKPEVNKPFKSVISLASDIIGKKINISEPTILINNKNNIPYHLEPFNTGLWILSFTPQQPGLYRIDFKVDFKPEIYSTEQYTFSGQFDIAVE